MDAFVSRKRRRISPSADHESSSRPLPRPVSPFEGEEECTDVKLAILSSLNPGRSHDDLLEILLSCEGSVEAALQTLSSTHENDSPRKRKMTIVGMQSSLPFLSHDSSPTKKQSQPLTKKGRTLHLYSPSDIAAHTPCSIIHNFLPPDLANALLQEMLPEVSSYSAATFKLFDNVVQSPHTACFYVSNLEERKRQRSEYLYNGSNLDDVREILPTMRQVSDLVQKAVNNEIKVRIRDHYPDGKKLQYQSSAEWQPNAAFVNCYDGGVQSVGYHSDQLSYLGPRAVIGSLSLGVSREFRVRKIVPKDEATNNNNSSRDKSNLKMESSRSNNKATAAAAAADEQGAIAIHLPHNSLLVMHAEMQEEWKHSISPSQNITPHPIAGNKRINITYRWYREEFNPKFTPRCRCGVPSVLKTVQRQRLNRGRYMWMCQVGGRVDPNSDSTSRSSAMGGNKEPQQQEPAGSATTARVDGTGDGTGGGGKGCGFFEWAHFTDEGEPIWKKPSDASGV